MARTEGPEGRARKKKVGGDSGHVWFDQRLEQGPGTGGLSRKVWGPGV